MGTIRDYLMLADIIDSSFKISDKTIKTVVSTPSEGFSKQGVSCRHSKSGTKVSKATFSGELSRSKIVGKIVILSKLFDCKLVTVSLKLSKVATETLNGNVN